MDELKRLFTSFIKEFLLYGLVVVFFVGWWLICMVYFTEIWGRLVIIGAVVIAIIYAHFDSKWQR
ncbi:hypothetical protein BF17_01090 [Yersinia similis]|uniref:Uncharacterized protein n=1 Tax=Yersinia similis TaxID=367190 RepID=A0ABN4CTL8_9GAMM|nr:hypothetical protein BF17_01090 [Yersinia similis]CFQ50911.1 Uncharacterised protein [Yersinia similis]CNB11861.1 Uncharacterised protein [Yersinia similis]CNE79854.1 Uncharacterised protein [Yersinia similis]